jgi:hypothetical protein
MSGRAPCERRGYEGLSTPHGMRREPGVIGTATSSPWPGRDEGGRTGGNAFPGGHRTLSFIPFRHLSTLVEGVPLPENLPGNIAETFPAELRSFYSLSLLSLVLGALALALGLSSIVTAVLAMAGEGGFGAFRLVQAFAGWTAAVIGVRWVLSMAKILSVVSGILGDYQALEGGAGGEPVPGKAAEGGLASETAGSPVPPGVDSPAETGPGAGPGDGAVSTRAIEALFLRMMTHYREHWKTWWKMRLIAGLGGWIFICLGVLSFIDGYPLWQAGVVPNLPFFTGIISIALGVVAMLASSRFRVYARTWEQRLIDAGQGEEILLGEQA